VSEGPLIVFSIPFFKSFTAGMFLMASATRSAHLFQQIDIRAEELNVDRIG